MKFDDLVFAASRQPIFETGFLLVGAVDPGDVRRQLSRWTQSGKVLQLRRGVYTLAAPYRQASPHPFLIANALVPASYVSLQSALAFHGMIPETVQRTISVTTGRPGRRSTPLGVFEYRHVQPHLLRGYRMIDLDAVSGQQALVATPGKAILDLVYLQPGGEAPDYLQEMRLQNLEQLDMDELNRQAGLFNTPKMHRAVRVLTDLRKKETEEFRTL